MRLYKTRLLLPAQYETQVIFSVSGTNHWRRILDNIGDAVKHAFNVVYERLLLTHFGDAVYMHLLSCVL